MSKEPKPISEQINEPVETEETVRQKAEQKPQKEKKTQTVGPPKIVVCAHCEAEIDVTTGDLLKAGKEISSGEQITTVISSEPEKKNGDKIEIGPPLFKRPKEGE